jgi:hypothetical protein
MVKINLSLYLSTTHEGWCGQLHIPSILLLVKEPLVPWNGYDGKRKSPILGIKHWSSNPQLFY